LYRGYHTSHLKTKDGLRVSGAYSSVHMVIKLINRFKPNSVVIAWDKGRSQPRMELYPDYKAQRAKNRKPEDAEAIPKNIGIAQSIFKHLPVKQIVLDGVEADDIIGYLTHRLKGKRIIVSNDQDFLQLVQKDVFVFLPNNNQLISAKSVEEFLGVPVDKYLIWKAMVGDSSDNIKGIKGVGPKRATTIVNNNEPFPKEWLETIERNVTLMNIGLVLTTENIVDIKRTYGLEQRKEYNLQKVKGIMAKYEFNSLLNRFYEVSNAFKGLRRKKTK
jgi:DNA polymerase-1